MTEKTLLLPHLLIMVATTLIGSAGRAASPPAEIVRALEVWRDYQGIQAKGVYEEIVNGETVVTKRFECCFGYSKNGDGFLPRSVQSFVRNPGEPHIPDEWICDHFAAVKDGVTVAFSREFVTQSRSIPPLSRVSVMAGTFLNYPGDHSGVFAIERILASHVNSFDYTDDPLPKNREFLSRYSLGAEQEHLGVRGRIVEAAAGDNDPSSRTHGLVYRALVAFDPTVRVLKYLDATGASPEVCELLNQERRKHRIKKLEVMSGYLVPTVYELGDETTFYRYTIDEVNRLPVHHQGLWNWDRPTGSIWYGDLEATIRNPEIHKKNDNGPGSVIPFTTEESEAIRIYFVKRNAPPPLKPTNWSAVLTYVASVASTACLAVVVFRYIRQG